MRRQSLFLTSLLCSFICFFLFGLAGAENIVVTGSPASPKLIQDVIKNYLKNNYYPDQIEDLNVSSDEDAYEYELKPLSIGEWQDIAFPLRFSSQQGRLETVSLNVYNQPCEQKPPDYLVLSNEPEAVRKPGLLSSFSLNKQEAARVVYYHKNSSAQDLFIALVADNPARERKKLHMIAGAGGPDNDSVFAGHISVKKFLNYYKNNEGVIVSVPEQQSRVLFYQWVKPGQIVSAVLELRLLLGQELNFKIIAETRETFGIAHFLAVNPEENKNRIGGIFAAPSTQVKRVINLDKRSVSFRIGEEPFITDFKTKRRLQGNYGLLYTYLLTLTNPGENAKIVRFYFIPNGGPARGIFLINNILKETDVAVPGRPQAAKLLQTSEIKPKETRELTVVTMPQPGSNYPVTLLVEVADSQ